MDDETISNGAVYYDEKDHSLKVKYVVGDETREVVLLIANVPSIDGHVYEENMLKLLSGKLHFQMKLVKCKRCGYTWFPRKDESKVRQCPKCKSAYWNKEKKKNKG